MEIIQQPVIELGSGQTTQPAQPASHHPYQQPAFIIEKAMCFCTSNAFCW
jgi:hypothetical protein